MGDRRPGGKETFAGLEEASPLRGFEDDDLAPGVALQLSGMMLRIAELEGLLAERSRIITGLEQDLADTGNVKPIRRRWSDTKKARDAVETKRAFDQINDIPGVHESDQIKLIWSHYVRAGQLVRVLDVFFEGG